MQQHGHLNEAKKLYLELLESIPDHPDSLHFLGLIYFQQGRIDKAKQLFEKSIKLNKNPTYLSLKHILFISTQIALVGEPSLTSVDPFVPKGTAKNFILRE